MTAAVLRRRATIAVGIALLAVAPAGGARGAGGDRTRVALLPLIVRASERRDVLQQGLADMLVARLGRDERLAVVEVEDPAAATDDAERARDVGREHDAAYVVYGTLTHVGEGAGLELRCAPVADDDAEPRGVFAQADTLSALIPLLDGMARRLAVHIAGPPVPPSQPPVVQRAGPGGDGAPPAAGAAATAPDRGPAGVR